MKVAYMGLVRNTLGISEEEIELPPGSRVSDLLSLLEQKHGENFRYSIFTNSGQLRPLVKVFIGERTIDDLEGLDTRIESESGVYILLLDHSLGGG
ncbi:MAG: MoaD/ThiS family protein [Dehalococcoidia bacterium]|nr:MoaD/ThiS family protein [Dehalococcoidia bacterium]